MVDSPCVSVCEMDATDNYCVGCYRTKEEIAQWRDADHRWKQDVIGHLAQRRQQAGFTFIQIALSMVAIGMMTGAVVVGQDMVHQAGLRQQMTQIEQIEAAIHNFRGKYGCFPGDCADPTIIDDYSYTGNGNGYLANTWNDDENKGFWWHLYASNIHQNKLYNHPVIGGLQTPKMNMNTQGYILAYGDIGYKRNVLEFATGGNSGAIDAVDIMNIDKKMDDGVATCGNIRSSGSGSGGNTIYDSAPVFPLSVNNNGGSTQCVIGKRYSTEASATQCNMLYLLDLY